MKVPSESKTNIHRRLRRLEGQVRGVQKMLDDDRECVEVLQQLAAIRAAAHRISIQVIREHAAACLLDPHESTSPQEVLDSLIAVLDKA